MARSAPYLTAITLGVRDVAASAAFYARLGFKRRVQATGNEVAFFDAGGVVLALYGWDNLAEDANTTPDPRPQAFRGMTLAWNCGTEAEVNSAIAQALHAGATLLKSPRKTAWGGYAGYFCDPDGHPWEVVHAPMFPLDHDGRLQLPD